MAELNFSGAGMDSRLVELLLNNDSIEPGSDASYEMCKQLWEYHPLGGKLVEKPIAMALFKPRENVLEDDPAGRIVAAFEELWVRLDINTKIKNLFFVSRCYGAAAVGVGTRSKDSETALDFWRLDERDLFINIFDPLTAAGSLVTSQDPNSPDFQQPKKELFIGGKPWHPSRTLKVFNGAPIYLSFQSSALGFTGRSVFQRALYPLRSYLQTMSADDMVSQKAGVLIAKMKQNSSTQTGVMQFSSMFKREKLKASMTGNVLSIGEKDEIESLNLQNIDGALTAARDNIIANIAAASDIPALLIKDEAFANGFGEGAEDAKAVAQYVDGVRQHLDPAIQFFERIIQHVAWNEAFFTALAADYPDVYAGKSYKDVFYQWQRGFSSQWASLMNASPADVRKGEGELVKQSVELFNALSPTLDPQNNARLVQWLAGVVNTLASSEASPLVLDYDDLAAYQPPVEPTFNAGGSVYGSEKAPEE